MQCKVTLFGDVTAEWKVRRLRKALNLARDILLSIEGGTANADRAFEGCGHLWVHWDGVPPSNMEKSAFDIAWKYVKGRNVIHCHGFVEWRGEPHSSFDHIWEDLEEEAFSL